MAVKADGKFEVYSENAEDGTPCYYLRFVSDLGIKDEEKANRLCALMNRLLVTDFEVIVVG